MGRSRLALAGLGLLLALGAWVLSSPVGSSPDEVAHLVRAVSAANGQWRGRPVPTGGRVDALAVNTRAFALPRRFRVADIDPCYARKPNVSASCGPHLTEAPVALSHVGTYYPPAYIPQGLAAMAAPTTDKAVYAARAVSVVLCAILLLCSMAWLHTRWERVGWLCGVGPLTLYIASSAATNGLEVTASLCVISTSIAIRRGRDGPTLWTSWTAGAVVLASAKSAGPMFLIFDLIAVLLVVQPSSPLRAIARRARGPLAVAGVAAAANLVWSLRFTRPGSSVPLSAQTAGRAVKTVVQNVPSYFSNFGWLDVCVPAHTWMFGAAAIIIVVAFSVAHATNCTRVSLGLVVAGAAAGTVAIALLGFLGSSVFQTRYSLAAIAPIPLLAASTSLRAPRAAIAMLVSLLMAAINAIALVANASRYALGFGLSLRFLTDAAWTPPGGWVLVVTTGAAGLSLLVWSTWWEPLSPIDK